MVARPLFEGPPAFSFERYRCWFGLWARTCYAMRWIRRAALGVEYAKGCEFEQGLHGSETGAEDSGVCFDCGPDAEVDEIICRGNVSLVASLQSGTARTGKIGRVLIYGNAIQAESSSDNDTGEHWSADGLVMGFTSDSHSA